MVFLRLLDVSSLGNRRLWTDRRPADHDGESPTLPSLFKVSRPEPSPHPLLILAASLMRFTKHSVENLTNMKPITVLE